MTLYYQIDYTLTDVPTIRLTSRPMAAVNPLPYKTVHTLLDDVRGQGQYVGTSWPGGE